MIERAATGERVYIALKTYLAEADLRPGERLDIGELSRRVAASATPVRSALHRMTGERLLVSHQGEGFSLPRVTEPGLSDLYAWTASVLSQAARLSADRPSLPPREAFAAPADPVEATARLFAYIAAFSGNVEVEWAIAGASDRLHRIRRLELTLVPEAREELADLVDATHAQDLGPLRQALLTYHRRRLRLVPALVRALHGLADREPR
ncbi:GntR family transcriptional regulator [Caulobacter segnis]